MSPSTRSERRRQEHDHRPMLGLLPTQGGTVTPDQAWRAMLVAGWPIVEVRSEGGGLEELYLNLTQREPA